MLPFSATFAAGIVLSVGLPFASSAARLPAVKVVGLSAFLSTSYFLAYSHSLCRRNL